MSTIWRAISKKGGWIVHFSNHRHLNAFLYENGVSSFNVDRIEYSKKADIIKMLNDSSVHAWMNGMRRKREKNT